MEPRIYGRIGVGSTACLACDTAGLRHTARTCGACARLEADLCDVVTLLEDLEALVAVDSRGAVS